MDRTGLSVPAGKRRRDIAHATGQRPDMEVAVQHLRPMAGVRNAAMRRLQPNETCQCSRTTHRNRKVASYAERREAGGNRS
jgi:hypothetical protein